MWLHSLQISSLLMNDQHYFLNIIQIILKPFLEKKGPDQAKSGNSALLTFYIVWV